MIGSPPVMAFMRPGGGAQRTPSEGSLANLPPGLIKLILIAQSDALLARNRCVYDCHIDQRDCESRARPLTLIALVSH